MKKLIAAVIASAFAIGTVSTFAAGAKKDELTASERTELRQRVTRLQQARANGEQKVVIKDDAKPKIHKVRKAHKAHKVRKQHKQTH